MTGVDVSMKPLGPCEKWTLIEHLCQVVLHQFSPAIVVSQHIVMVHVWYKHKLLGSQVYWWHDKYRPRKPKYFNRVHTGYEWNKYNQTHYDHDNPPPKIVQGYKFNIFYPDLVDKTKAPTYFIEKDGDSTETCIIRFHAGPPYEDIVCIYIYFSSASG